MADPADDRELARALEAIGRSISRLIGLLDSPDEGDVVAAALALVKIGPAAVAPIASALPTAPGPRHRGLMVVVLGQLAGRDPSGVAAAVEVAIAAERDPAVLAMATAARNAVAASRGCSDGTAPRAGRARGVGGHAPEAPSSRVDRGRASPADVQPG